MKIGTKSVLFGAHQFLIHPWFVAAAWWKLYGFPLDPRLWVAFFVHDLGYVGKPNMDGAEGEQHVELGAGIMHRLFDRPRWRVDMTEIHNAPPLRTVKTHERLNTRWRDFCLYHSRFYAKRDGVRPSKLCAADKLAVALEPWWLYLPRAILSGEIEEYMHLARKREGDGPRKYTSMNLATDDRRKWFASVQTYLRRWADEHKDGREDTWTPAQRQAADATGVWR